MKKILFCILVFFLPLVVEGNASESNPYQTDVEKIFNIGKMLSHDKKFTLFFKPRDKAILAKGQEFNYITDHPKDLYLYIHNLLIKKKQIIYIYCFLEAFLIF